MSNGSENQQRISGNNFPQPVYSGIKAEKAILRPKGRITLRQRIAKNWLLKSVSFVIGLMLFFFVLSDKNVYKEFTAVPVAISLPSGYAYEESPNINSVKVTLSGRISLLKDVTQNSIGTIAIVAPSKIGIAKVLFSEDMLNLPKGVSVKSFDPPSLNLSLEEIAKKSVTVSTEHIIVGQPQVGYQLGKITVSPGEIDIYGPGSLVYDLSHVYVEPIDVTGRNSDFSVERWVITNRRGVEVSGRARVQVSVEIAEKREEIILKSIPIFSVNLNEKHEFMPPKVDIAVYGSDIAVKDIDTSKVFISVDCSEDNGKAPNTRVFRIKDEDINNLPPGVVLDSDKAPGIALITKTADSP